jgi:hypothetical protein
MESLCTLCRTVYLRCGWASPLKLLFLSGKLNSLLRGKIGMTLPQIFSLRKHAR